VPPPFIASAYEDDPASASAEYGARFRTDVEGFVSPEVVQACVVRGRYELPPIDGKTYFGFCDPSGGSNDSMTLCISSREGNRVVIDVVREVVPPFSPESVVAEFAALLKRYRLSTIVSDRYAGQWTAEAFRRHGIQCDQAAKPKSDLYKDLLPVLNSGGVELLDHAKAIQQLCGLERRTARGGRDSIDHAPNAHDDLANVIAGAVLGSAVPQGGADGWISYMRQLAIEEGLDPVQIEANLFDLDTDDVRAAGPTHGWNFYNPDDHIDIIVPPGPLADEGRIIFNGLPRTFHRFGEVAKVHVTRTEAHMILSTWNPVWARTNYDLAETMGIKRTEQ
jgi:hypothetical protein